MSPVLILTDNVTTVKGCRHGRAASNCDGLASRVWRTVQPPAAGDTTSAPSSDPGGRRELRQGLAHLLSHQVLTVSLQG